MLRSPDASVAMNIPESGRRALAAALGSMLAFALLEVTLRCTDWVPEVRYPMPCHDNDPRLGWRGRANLRVRFVQQEFDTLVVHDAEGWREKEPPGPPAAAHRLLFLGDSFTWGWGVSQGQVFTDHLQAALSPEVEVVNRGVDAFGTSQELLLLQDELARHSFERVVVMLCINDFADNTDSRGGRRPLFDLVDGQLVPRNQPPALFVSPTMHFLKEHCSTLAFAQFLSNSIKKRLEAREVPPVVAAAAPRSTDRLMEKIPGEDLTIRLLLEMKHLAELHGASFWIVPIVVRASDNDVWLGDARLPAVLAALHQDSGIPIVDLTEAFRSTVQAGRKPFYPRDWHWNPEGHSTAAQALLASELCHF